MIIITIRYNTSRNNKTNWICSYRRYFETFNSYKSLLLKNLGTDARLLTNCSPLSMIWVGLFFMRYVLYFEYLLFILEFCCGFCMQCRGRAHICCRIVAIGYVVGSGWRRCSINWGNANSVGTRSCCIEVYRLSNWILVRQAETSLQVNFKTAHIFRFPEIIHIAVVFSIL